MVKTNLKKIYEGKAKIIFEGPDSDTCIQQFKDEATAFNAKKKSSFPGKGKLNNTFSSYFMETLHAASIKTHFIKKLDHTSQLIRHLEIIPIEVVVRFVVAGSLKRLGLQEGTILEHPIVEFYYKSDNLEDPILTHDHILLLKLASELEIDWMTHMALRISDYLAGVLYAFKIKLIDIKLEFGRTLDKNHQVDIILADEITPDTCRFWDIHTNEHFDKDVFRYDLNNLLDTYTGLAKRLGLQV